MSVAEYIEEMVNGYAECLLWISHYVENHDEGCNREECECATTRMDEAFTTEDFHQDLMDKIEEDCQDFFASNWEDLAGMDPQRAGHDFLLTRQRHGAGFWDRGLGEKGDRLTESAHAYGDHHIEAEDGFIYSAD